MAKQFDKQLAKELQEGEKVSNGRDEYKPPPIDRTKAKSLNLGYRIVNKRNSIQFKPELQFQSKIPEEAASIQSEDTTKLASKRIPQMTTSTDSIKKTFQLPPAAPAFKSSSSLGVRLVKKPKSATSTQSLNLKQTGIKKKAPLLQRQPSATASKSSLKSTSLLVSEQEFDTQLNEESLIKVDNEKLAFQSSTKTRFKKLPEPSFKLLRNKPKQQQQQATKEPIVIVKENSVLSNVESHPPSAGRNTAMSSQQDVNLLSYRRKTSISTERTRPTTYQSENKSIDLNILSQRSFNKVNSKLIKRSILDNQFALSGTDKARFLFEYLYGMQGLPIRTGSSLYSIPFKKPPDDCVDMIAASTERSNPSQTSSGSEEAFEENLTEEEKYYMQFASTNSLSNSVFGDWLADYERKKSRLMHRMNRAKENNEYLTSEQQRLWLSSIARKSSSSIGSMSSGYSSLKQKPPFITPFSSPRHQANSSNEKQLKAVISNIEGGQINRSVHQRDHSFIEDSTGPSKRSKSVSFVLDTNMYLRRRGGSAARPTSEQPAKDADGNVKTKPIIRLQPAYLVSQIEMEEIFAEALKKVEIKKQKFESSMQHKANIESSEVLNSKSFNRPKSSVSSLLEHR